MITFEVDKVELATEALPTCKVKDLLNEETEPYIYLENHKEELFVKNSEAPSLISLLHMSFSQHRPLILSPDVIWLTIIQGVAFHLDKNHEKLRKKFVDFKGQKTLNVTLLEMDFPEVIRQFSELISEETGENSELFRCNFSTSTQESRIASEIIMLSTFKHYFEMVFACVCGIPKITLKGETEDWEKISEKLEHFRKYELGWWIDELKPALAEFTEASKGNINLDFWQNLYKFQEEYGSNIVNGHICLFYPYLKDYETDQYTNPNPFITDRSNTVYSSSFPPGMTSAPLIVKGLDKTRKMDLHGGLFGIKQHTDFSLEVLPGWYVEEKPFYFDDVQALKKNFDSCSDLTEAINTYSKQLLNLCGAKDFSIYKVKNDKSACYYSTINGHQKEFNRNPPEVSLITASAEWDSYKINISDYSNNLVNSQGYSTYSSEPLPTPHVKGVKQYALRSFCKSPDWNGDMDFDEISAKTWTIVIELLNTNNDRGFHPDVLDFLYCFRDSTLFDSLENFGVE